jgi:Ser/Thr protein kinase RdoA (MazF antagonist)
MIPNKDYSILDAPSLASFLARQYGFTDVRCHLLIRGVGDTYLVETATGRCILRVYRSTHRSVSQITAEVELLLAAHAAGVSVSYPLGDRTGDYIQAFPAAEGERHAVLFSYAPGVSIRIMNEAQLSRLGREIALFHDVSAAIRLSDRRWTFDPETTLLRPLEVLQPYFAELPEEYAWWQAAAAKVTDQLSGADGAGISSGYCHFDLLPKNFHFDEDSPTLFDFDFFGYGWLVNDLMTFWVHLCLDVHFGKLSQEAADAAYSTFLRAYRQERPLSDAEARLVPWLSLGFWGFYMGFHTTHDQFHAFVQPAQLKARTAMIRQMTERYCDLSD